MGFAEMIRAIGLSLLSLFPAVSGRATWYAKGLSNPHRLTAAHRTLPKGTRLRVVNDRNGRSVVVTINDRGPNVADTSKVLDLSLGAARRLNMVRAGVAPVRAWILESP